MDLDTRLQNVSVIGAAGKMGSGITLLLAQEMARLSLLPENRGRVFRLNAIDLDPAGLIGLREYLHAQATKTAEKTIVALRTLYADRPDLVENGDIIADYVRRVGDLVWPATDLGAARGSTLVFEAIVEKTGVKASVFRQLRDLCPEAYFLTNTSSIPIGEIDREAGLGGRVIGFHFYNPPPVQKLVEVIRAETTPDELSALAAELGRRLRKTLIPSADVAGFIGNGHFIRDGLHGLNEAQRLSRGRGWARGAWLVNRVSQDWLLRPMGIFQLIDYVGIDVFQMIQIVMDEHLDEHLRHEVIDRALELGVRGGQNPDGSQKPGFFRYEKGRPVAAYDLEARDYVPIDASWDEELGPLPEGFRPWKALTRAPDRDEALAAHFGALAGMDTLGAQLAKAYLARSREIGRQLVEQKVAASEDDVNRVLMLGFYHLYGPINDYCA
ncbi:MAG: 3-hydroxyacyl-CoA dehydrogenase family protein [Acidobacteria bacterium]|nr:MAG: 3-hydroxyacyl-CoA dehydrogenase family protein [Acidobacteriota bacterium]